MQETKNDQYILVDNGVVDVCLQRRSPDFFSIIDSYLQCITELAFNKNIFWFSDIAVIDIITQSVTLVVV